MNLNLENKKQIIILALAVTMGFLSTLLMSRYIGTSINRKTELLAQDFDRTSKAEKAVYEQRLAALAQDVDARLKQAVDEVKKAAASNEGKKGPVSKPLPISVLSAKMPPGKRALTIDIPPLLAVGGLVNSGDFVDVIIELRIPNPQKPADDKDIVTSVVFQNIQVLAVDGRTQAISNMEELQDRLKSKTINVTLAVSPEEAGLLTFAQANGTISFSLRAPNEKATEKVSAANWQSLSEFVEKQQGTKILAVPEPEEKKEEKKVPVQIFKSGIEY